MEHNIFSKRFFPRDVLEGKSEKTNIAWGHFDTKGDFKDSNQVHFLFKRDLVEPSPRCARLVVQQSYRIYSTWSIVQILNYFVVQS